MLVENQKKGTKEIVFIYTTCSSMEEARSISLSAINEKLAVCGDFWEINSVYPWKGVIQDVFQYMLMLTTERDMSDKLIKFVEGVHSYSVPMVVQMETSYMNLNYKFWLYSTLNGKEDYISEEEERYQNKDSDGNGYHFGKLK